MVRELSAEMGAAQFRVPAEETDLLCPLVLWDSAGTNRAVEELIDINRNRN